MCRYQIIAHQARLYRWDSYMFMPELVVVKAVAKIIRLTFSSCVKIRA